MTKIVIVGGGFAGLMAAFRLGKKFPAGNTQITLIDRHGYHLFVPTLYEVATSEEELVSVNQVKKSITVPFSELLNGKKIEFVKGELTLVDAQKKQISVGQKQIPYDYLILALGSQTDFLNIEGAQKYSMTLKSLPDALRLRNQIEFAVQEHREDINKKTLRLVVAGGGYTGLELAGELKGLSDYLAWKNGYPREKIEIEVIEAANKLVSGFDERLSDDAYSRIGELGIRVDLSSRVIGVDANFIQLMSGEKVAYDVLVWATGVKGPNVNITPAATLDRKGRLQVNGYFQAQGYDNIFAIGDMACVIGTNGQPAPSTAQDAIDQAKYLASALPYILKNQRPPVPYKNKSHGFIVALGGKWAIMDYGPFYIKGYLGYLGHLFAHFNYYRSIVGFWKAFKWVFFEAEMFGRND